MDEVTRAKMALHKELKLKVNSELAKDNFITMQKEAKEFLTLNFLVKKMQKKSIDNGFDSIDINDLSSAIDNMRDSIIYRWISLGVPIKDISSAFKLQTAKISQIKKEALEKESIKKHSFF